MKKFNIFSFIILFFIFLFTIFVSNVSADTNNWAQVGKAGFSTGSVMGPSLFIGKDNTPYVSYFDKESKKIYVMKFNGTSWVQIGENEAYNGYAISVSFLLDNNDIPYLVMGDLEKTTIKIIKFNGSKWEDVTLEGLMAKTSIYPSLSFDKDNNMYVSYLYVTDIEKDQNPKNSVAKFNGNKWEELKGMDSIKEGNFCLSLNFDYEDVPYLSCVTQNKDEKSSFIKYNGTSWQKIGDIDFSYQMNPFVQFTFDKKNNLYYSSINNKNFNSEVFKYESGSWKILGDMPSAGENISYESSITIDSNDMVYLAHTTSNASSFNNIKVLKFNGKSWENIGDSSLLGNKAYLSSDRNGVVYLTYQDYNLGNKISVVKYGNFPGLKLDPVLSVKGCSNGEKFNTITGSPCALSVVKTTNHFVFTKSLKFGSDHNDTTEVNQLQKFLNSKGFIISSTGIYSPGKETKFFGTVVKNALIKFQKKYGLTPDGSFGPKTIAKVNEILGEE